MRAPDSAPTPAQARARANKAEALVRHLRGLLGQAMADAVEARRVAREAERTAG